MILHGAGNFMYFAANSKYMIMGSRFIVGESIICLNILIYDAFIIAQ